MGAIARYKGADPLATFDPDKVDQADDVANMASQTAFGVAGFMNKQQAARDAAFVSSRAIDLETKAANRMNEWQKKHELNPLGQEKDLQDMIQKDFEELGKDAPSGAARESLTRMTNGIKTRYSVNGANWANEQVVKNAGHDIDRSSQTLQMNAFRSGNEAALEDIFKQHDTLVVTAQQALGPENARKVHEIGRRNIVAKTVEGMIDKNDLRGARRLLDSKKYDETLGAEATANAYELLHRKQESNNDRTAKLHELMDRDPWKFLGEVGDNKGAAPLDLTKDPAKSFENRFNFVAGMQKKYPGIQLPVISPDESRHISDSLLSMSPKDAAGTLNNLAIKVPNKKQLGGFGKELFKEEPGLGAAMMIAGDAPGDARRVVHGTSLLRKGNGGKPIQPPGERLNQEFDSILGNAIEDPNMRMATRQAAEAHMVSSMFDKGAMEFKDFDSDDLKKSVQSIVGPVAEINGRKTLSFRGKSGQFLDEDALDDLIDDLTDKNVEKSLGDVPRTMSGEPINLAKSNGRLEFKAVADGVYWVFRDGQPALDKNKQPFRMDLKKIESTMPKKRGFLSKIFGGNEAQAQTPEKK